MCPCFVVLKVCTEDVIGGEGEFPVTQHEAEVCQTAHDGFWGVGAVEALKTVVVGV